MSSRPSPIEVWCYAGWRGEETPRRLRLGGRQVPVVEVLDRWQGPDHRTFKLRAAEGVYTVRHRATDDRWELLGCRMARAEEGPETGRWRSGGIAPLRTLQRSALRKGRRRASDVEPGERRRGSRRVLECAQCRAAVTFVEERIEVGGRHVHRCINPSGIEYTIGCFTAAAGVAAVGPATSEHSWFPGAAWRVGVCRRCSTHLGWRFEGGAPTLFDGLILDRLVEAAS